MLLSVPEAAQILGCSERTVRKRLAAGELPGRKRGGRWVVPRDVLPLPEAEHRRLQQRAQSIRETVDAALPSRSSGQRTRRSLVDEPTFRAAHALRTQLLASEHPSRGDAAMALEEGLRQLTAGVYAFRSPTKLAALTEARHAFARAAVALLLETPLPPEEPVRTWLLDLEHEVLPPLAGLFRVAERARKAR